MLPPLARNSTSVARIAPLLRISPSSAGRRTETLPLPSEPSLSTTSLPEAIAAVPLRAVSEPSLRTWRAIRTTSPFDAPILPRLTTEALLLPLKVSDPPAKLRILDVQRRGDKTAAGLDLPARPDDHPRRIDEIDRAGRRQ